MKNSSLYVLVEKRSNFILRFSKLLGILITRLVYYLTPDGVRRNVLQKGVNILRYSDGTEKKIIVN